MLARLAFLTSGLSQAKPCGLQHLRQGVKSAPDLEILAVEKNRVQKLIGLYFHHSFA